MSFRVAEIRKNPRISLTGALSHDTAAQAAKRQEATTLKVMGEFKRSGLVELSIAEPAAQLQPSRPPVEEQAALLHRQAAGSGP
jgi:hypothetical protein